jgi:hypothetical protein
MPYEELIVKRRSQPERWLDKKDTPWLGAPALKLWTLNGLWRTRQRRLGGFDGADTVDRIRIGRRNKHG